MKALIVGGSSVAGQATIETIRKKFPDSNIIVTTSGETPPPGADHTIKKIDLNEPTAAEEIIKEVNKVLQVSTRLDYLVYTPAFGPIGYPTNKATPEEIKKAMAFSYDPMMALVKGLSPGLTISFTAFYWLPHTLDAYGAMAAVKAAQEKLAIDQPEKFKAVRAGTFRSKATRGIGLLLQRSLKDTIHEPIKRMGEKWRASGKKFSDYFFDYAFDSERITFGSRFREPHRPTEAGDIVRALTMIFDGEKAPVVSVIGDWTWVDFETHHK